MTTRATFSVIITRTCGRSSIPEMLILKSIGCGVLDTPQEPVIELAEGKTRWRGMTIECGSNPSHHRKG
jgi:hypothetical protein